MDATAAFHRATELRECGDLAGLKALFASGNDVVKAAVLNGLSGEPGENPEMGPGIISLAVAGAGHPSPEVRRMACYVFQDQCAWGVDVSPAVGPLLALLGDPDAEVRRMAAFATGNVCKRRFDWSRHFTALRRLLRDKALYVPEAAAWALAKMSRAKHDIGPAVPDLVRVLASRDEYNEPQKESAKALLHHARKSQEGRDQVRRAVTGVTLETGRKEITRFLDQLGDL
jgi:hypothetical protein